MGIELLDPVELNTRKALRKTMRKRRRALSHAQLQQASNELFYRVAPSNLFRFSRRIAFSMARDGEISPDRLLPAIPDTTIEGRH